MSKREPVRKEHTPPGFGSLKHRPKPIKAPSSLAGRRAAAHGKAYQDETTVPPRFDEIATLKNQIVRTALVNGQWVVTLQDGDMYVWNDQMHTWADYPVQTAP